ncbi:hypothetical protein [Chryseobacterium sp. G0201]|uniref:hypothetical protein n=1 Tax=Chryseobacterium sp. G0201 TaxID=2487065 RepID=UPI000F4E306D|nr:hypothetical protein [Chryseobacterium sp. G0201]
MKLKLSILTLLTFLLMSSCKEKIKELTKEQDQKSISQPEKEILVTERPLEKTQLEIQGDKIIVPDFRLEVNLSDKAVKKLKESKESVIASLYLYGDVADENLIPKKFKKLLGPTGIKLTSLDIEKKEINQSNEFQVTNISFPKELYDLLASKDVLINISVYSGRRTFKDNILYMEAYDSKLSDIIAHSSFINLNGRLLTEGFN